MDLKTYLFVTNTRKFAFASKLGIHRSYLFHILSGLYRPSKSLAKRIEKETKGKVTALEVLDLYDKSTDRMKAFGLSDEIDPRQLDMLKDKS